MSTVSLDTNDPRHQAPDHQAPDHLDESVCWLLDVRRYGLEVANRLHEDERARG